MPNARRRATLIGMIALGFWAALALLTVQAGGIPPFQLLAMNTAVAFLLGTAFLVISGRPVLQLLRQPLAPWITAVTAIFLYHALYFFALASAPPARASLIAYFWPLLIVIFAGLLPGSGGLQLRHLIGAGLGLFGVALIFADRAEVTMQAGSIWGYFAAAGCAVIWSGYSVINRRFSSVPSEMLIGVCGAVAVISTVAHVIIEQTVVPNAGQWVAIVLLGIGPVGLAFLAWDYATKHGNLPLLGALSYMTPLISTLLLVLFGMATPTIWLAFAVIFVVAGAALASSTKSNIVES